jgi:hypothetical protein
VEELRFHFSVDDVFDAFIDVADRRLELFEQPFFGFLQALHAEFGVVVHLYVFHRKAVHGRRRSLEEVPETVGAALRRSRWLHLGPHALDYDTPPYAQTPDQQVRALDAIYAELDRFAPDASRSPWVRLHCFSETYEIASYLGDRGVSAILTTDKPAVAYRLPDALRRQLQEEGEVAFGGIRAIRSHFRLETLVAAGLTGARLAETLDAALSAHGRAVVMTHECEVPRPEVREMARAVLRHLTSRGAISV